MLADCKYCRKKITLLVGSKKWHHVVKGNCSKPFPAQNL